MTLGGKQSRGFHSFFVETDIQGSIPSTNNSFSMRSCCMNIYVPQIVGAYLGLVKCLVLGATKQASSSSSSSGFSRT